MNVTVLKCSTRPILELNEKIRILHADYDSAFLKITKQYLELKRAREAHGGRILVESQAGKGTTFVVHIPIEQDSEPTKDFIVDLRKPEVDAKVVE